MLLLLDKVTIGEIQEEWKEFVTEAQHRVLLSDFKTQVGRIEFYKIFWQTFSQNQF